MTQSNGAYYVVIEDGQIVATASAMDFAVHGNGTAAEHEAAYLASIGHAGAEVVEIDLRVYRALTNQR